MVTLDFIAALQARDISFTNFRNALKNHNLPASTGWDPTVEKLKPGLTGQDKEKYAVAIESIHNELTSFGDKCLKVFEVDSVYLKALIESMTKDFVCDSDLSDHYPYPMPRDELQEYNGVLPALHTCRSAISTTSFFALRYASPKGRKCRAPRWVMKRSKTLVRLMSLLELGDGLFNFSTSSPLIL